MKKIIGFELKKLVSRIGIYILALLLAGLLVASAFIYNPIKRDTTPLSLTGDTVSEMYNNFNNDLKQGYVDSIEEIANNASTYIPTSANYMIYNNANSINTIFTQLDNLCIMYGEANLSNTEYETLRNDIQRQITNLDVAIKAGITPCDNQQGYYILTTKNNYANIKELIGKTSQNFISSTRPAFAGENYNNELRAPLYDCINALIYPNLKDVANKYQINGTYYTLVTSRMAEISQKIDNEYNKVVKIPNLNTNQDIKDELNILFNRYANWVEIFETSYKTSMCSEALNSVTNKSARANLVGYSEVSVYEQEEKALQYIYYIEHNVSSNEFANSLSVTHTSNGKINAYDFTFYVMSLFAVVVIIYAIFLSAHTISGEISNNTMRFTALRPVKRGSIFFGKYFAILTMCFILLLFGTITSLCVGGILFGFNSANILMIVNGNIIFNAHPIIAIILFIFSLLFIIALYSALTMMLSSLLKSDLLVMLIGIVIYAVNLILPLFFGINSWLRFNPLSNINLFAYFGTTRLTSDSVLAKLFNNIVYHGMNIWISLIYVFGITTILLLIGRHLFKKREL